MHEQHKTSGPGTMLKWKQTEGGDWVRKSPSDDTKKKEKRKADGNLSPADKAEAKKNNLKSPAKSSGNKSN